MSLKDEIHHYIIRTKASDINSIVVGTTFERKTAVGIPIQRWKTKGRDSEL